MTHGNGVDVGQTQVHPGPRRRRRWLRRLLWLAAFIIVFPIVQVMALRFIDRKIEAVEL